MATDLLIFGAHPDDAEIGMGGTIAKHAAANRNVVICDLTFAEMSSNGDVETRQREAEEAAAILGVKERINLGLPDRGLRMEDEQLKEIVKVIRTYQPKAVFAPYWEDRHPDHTMCSRMVQEAVFSAKLRKWMPEMPAYAADQLYFYFINDMHAPDLIVDVTSCYEQKMKALQAYRSQFTRADGSVKTPLNQGYIANVEARDRLFGQRRLIQYAEGFKHAVPYLVNQFV